MFKYLFIFLVLIPQAKIFAQLPFPFVPVQKESYYNAYNYLVEHERDYIGSKYEDQYWQALATISSFTGNYEKALKCYHIRDSVFNKLPANIKIENASEFACTQEQLNNLYQKNRVVFLNEAHYMSSDRAFLFNQLGYLRDNGYKYLAIEALNNGEWRDSLLNQRGYPQYLKTGIYINDPIFANVIRKAIKLGFTLIPYESYNKNREEEQAENILKNYDPKEGKLVVFAGFAHICEDIENKLMGGILKEKLGEEVLSISQYLPQDKFYTNIDSTHFYLIKSANTCYDYYLALPKLKNISNLPGWFDKLLNFKYIQLDSIYPGKLKYPSLIQVYIPNETNSIPVYQYLTGEIPQEKIYLAVPNSGEYKLKILNSVQEDSLTVNIK